MIFICLVVKVRCMKLMHQPTKSEEKDRLLKIAMNENADRKAENENELDDLGRNKPRKFVYA